VPVDIAPTHYRLRKQRGFTTMSMLAGIASFSTLGAVWGVIWWLNLFDRGLLPAPWEVLNVLTVQMTEKELWLDILLSARRVVVGVFCGLAIALPVGFILGWYKSVRAFIDPVINFFRALPPIALIPLVIVYFGIGELARLSVLIYAAFFSSVIVIYEGIKMIPPIYIRVSKALGATDFEIFKRIVVPAALPHVLTAFRVSTGVCWTTLVAAELVAAERGLGAVIVNGQNFFQVPVIFVGIIMIGAVAVIMDQLLRYATAHLLTWQESI
jgi:NitT/TauT family transport system permease protein